MWSFSALCDDFYVNSRLLFKLELDPNRESLLHFFEMIRRKYPALMRFRRREDDSLVLDEEGEARSRRFVRLDPMALKFGYGNPADRASLDEYGAWILQQAPHQLSLSPLDYDYMEVTFGFDLDYRGNHDELVAETLFGGHPVLNALAGDGEAVIDCQPFWGISLNEACDTQAYVEVKGRTSTFEVRTGEYDETPLSVYLTLRRYWGVGSLPEVHDVYGALLKQGERLAEERVVPHLVQPLATAIAQR